MGLHSMHGTMTGCKACIQMPKTYLEKESLTSQTLVQVASAKRSIVGQG
jgi:AhpD family alkylhydroperoxidase